VDDEPRVLDGLRRSLHGSFDVVTATSGEDGLALQREALAGGDPFAVIVSDMRMPGMDGAEFLTAARAVDRDTVRMVLSGQADLAQTIAAVNHADLFRSSRSRANRPISPARSTTRCASTASCSPSASCWS
jgi:response regulator RpfG family c-di-GMP phosphodiesterase